MAITYPVDVANTRWAIYQISTGEIVARRKVWPREDGGEIVGQDPDFVYLMHVDDAQPQYDSRLFTLEGTEGVDVDANVLHLTWDAVARPNEERNTAAENEETNQLARHISLHREVIENRLMLGALLHYVIDAQALPPKAATMADLYKAKALKLWQNRDRLDEILAQIANGEQPDLDAGWADE